MSEERKPKCLFMMFLLYRYKTVVTDTILLYNMLLQASHYRMIGTFVAMSIIQGGSGLPIFSQHLYSYLTSGKYINLDIKNEDVPDLGVQALLHHVIVTIN